MKTKAALLLFLSGCFTIQGVCAWQLPLQDISAPECKSLHWSEHGDTCKKDFFLPEETVVSGGENTIQKLLFSVLYQSSYTRNDGASGGHPGIDIVSAKGTPVLAIYDGIVTRSAMSNGYGNVIVIKHIDGEEIVYSNYAHLDTRLVEEGDAVHSGQKIGEIGNTGFTIGLLGNHLDFQITTPLSPSHPYAYIDCEAGYMNAVDQGLCANKLYLATHNPFEFLHAKMGTKSTEPLVQAPREISTNIPASPDPIQKTPKDNTISSNTISATISEHNIFEGHLGKIMIDISADTEQPIHIQTSNETLALFKETLWNPQEGRHTILFQGKEKGTTLLTLSQGDVIIDSFEVTIK